MGDLATALGLVLVLEGLLYGAFPMFARRLAREAAGTPDATLRMAGLGAMALGLAIVWLVRG